MTENPTNIYKTSLKGLLVIKRPVFKDERGFFHEIVRMNDLKTESGIDFKPVQISHSLSIPKVIRAIHSEGWNKLVYPVTGTMFAAIVDVRPESPTFGKYETFTFNNDDEASEHMALFIPKGFANSICVVGNTPVNYIYAVDEYWDNAKAQGVAWDDPDLNIPWPVENPIISERDKGNPKMRDLFPEKFK